MNVVHQLKTQLILAIIAVVAVVSLTLLIGCEKEKTLVTSHNKTGHTISRQIELAAGVQTEFPIKPAIKVFNKVQYVTLSLPLANMWRSGTEPGDLINADEETINISVEVITASRDSYSFDSVSFGKDLMFSYLPETANSQQPGLPKNKQITTVRIISDKNLVIDAINWRDITNK